MRRTRGSANRPTAPSRSRTVSASYAAKNFGALVDSVRETHAVYVVERSGQPVVRVVPAPSRPATLTDLADLFREPGRLPEEFLREVEHGIAGLNRPAVPRDPWAS